MSRVTGRGRACLYHRCSTLDQDASLAREELRQAARARGLEIALEVEEKGSGARCDRPGLQRVLLAARRGEITTVLVYKLDRWGRSVVDVLHNIKVLNAAGVEFIAISQGLHIMPNADAVSGLILGVLASVAAFELDLIRSRTMLGLDKARRAGRSLGRPRKGAKPDPGVVARLRAGGASWAVVADQLGCTVASARRACQIGTPILKPEPCDSAAAA